MKKRSFLRIIIALVITTATFACGEEATLEKQLRTTIEQQDVATLDPGESPDPALVALGQLLFFDKELSGNRDIACATCHHPTFSSGDGLSVSIGTGGSGLGIERQIGYDRGFIPRNAPEVFNRGAAEWTTMFWDSRVSASDDGGFITPAGEQLPPGLMSVLAAQAMFPVTSDAEMRGLVGDVDVNGAANELAGIDSDDLPAIWEGLMARVLAIPAYVEKFQAAYPDTAVEDLGFQHVANAIAAFEIAAYSLYHSPWYNYLEGDASAISAEAKRGALLFYGEAGCVACHSGPLFTDQRHHVLAVPQVGPGKGESAPLDMGRGLLTDVATDMYAFRTPPLHNVAASGPWMHDGAFSTLEAVIRHHMNPAQSLLNYDPAQHLPADLQRTFQNDPALLNDMLAQVDPLLEPSATLSDEEVQYLIAFLETLTDPALADLTRYVPDGVPSGLPVAD